MVQVTLDEIASLLDAELVGEGDTVLSGIAGIEEAGEGHLTFVANPKYKKGLETTRASAAIVPPNIREAPVALLITPDPYLAFTRALSIFHPESPAEPGVSGEAWVDPSAEIHSEATVFPFVYVGRHARVGARTVLYPFVNIGEDAVLGEDCRLYSHVSVREGCVLGDRVILHCGVMVGSDGFGFAQQGHQHLKIPQVGIVRIEDDVEIGAGSCVDRATMGETRIGRGTKIDNLVQVAHNVQIGEDVILVSQVGISGSTSVGDRSMLGGQVGIVGHVQVGKDVKIGAKSGIHTSVPDGQIIAGAPAQPYQKFMRTMAVFKQLPQLRERVLALEREVEALKETKDPKEEEGEGS